VPAFVYKLSTEPGELEQIHRLNYATFVEEIPQHAPAPSRLLIDKFHAQNTYIVCLRGAELAGMVAVRDQRPFSLDAKVADLDRYLPPHCKPCEIRLLAVQPAYRRSRVLWGLLVALAGYCDSHGYDLALISGTVRQLKLYQKLNFTPFGDLVGSPGAQYQPMYLTRAGFEALRRRLR
jgi:hypothetical protein